MTSTTGRRVRRLLTASAVLALVTVPGAAAHAGEHGDSNDKQTICHADSSDTKPYVINTPNKNGDVDGHADHTGPIWNPSLKADHDWWGDIIPPFDYNEDGQTLHFAGLNWDANGQAWFANDCRVPITGTVDKTNDANGDATYSDDETATAEGAAVPFSVTVTNTSVVPAVVTSLVDTVSGNPVAFTPSPDPVGSTLAPGASVTFTFTVSDYSPPDGGSVVNDLAVVLTSAADEDNDATVHDTSTVRTAVPPPPAPDVSVVKSGPATASPGDQLTWTMTVTNDGSVPAPDVTVTDELPAGTTLVSASGTGWTCGGTTTVTCTLDDDLAVSGSASFTIVATLAADYTDATVVNTAVVTPEDETPADNTSTATTDVTTGGGGGTVTPPFTGGGGGVTNLPRTGTASWELAAIGIALLMCGANLVLLPVGARRRS